MFTVILLLASVDHSLLALSLNILSGLGSSRCFWFKLRCFSDVLFNGLEIFSLQMVSARTFLSIAVYAHHRNDALSVFG